MKKVFSIMIAVLLIASLCLTAAAEKPTEVTFGEAIVKVECSDNLGDNGINSRYLIVFAEDVDTGSAYVSLDVDGRTVGTDTRAAYFSPPPGGAAKPYFYIEYRALEDGVTEASMVGRHIVTIKAGTLFQNGTMSLSKDIVLLIEGASVSLYTSNVTLKPLMLTGLHNSTTVQEDLHRYKIIFTDTISDEQFGIWSSMAVDDSRVITAADQGICAYNHGDSLLTVYINYDAVQPGATVSSDVTAHIITLRKGTVYGDYELTEDVRLKVEGSSVLIMADEQHLTDVTFGETISVAECQNDLEANDINSRYLIVFDEDVAVGSAYVTIDVDGTTISADTKEAYFSPPSSESKPYFYIEYRALESGVTKAEHIGRHIVTIKAGALFQNGTMQLANDIVLLIDGTSVSIYDPDAPVTIVTTPVTLTSLYSVEPQEDLQRYKVIFADNISGQEFGVWCSMTVDGSREITEADQGICVYNHGDNLLTFYINYSAIQPGATVSSDVEKHIITLRKGMIFGEFELAEDVLLKAEGGSVSLNISEEDPLSVNDKGDVNGDGEINNKDVVVLFRFVSSNKSEGVDKEVADINGDGEINNKDVVSLFRKVSAAKS